MYLTIKQLNQKISDLLPKKNYQIKGEVSQINFKGKHCYLTLKDENDKIHARIFYYKNMLIEDFKIDDLKEGDIIKCSGRFNFYFGSISIIINQIISKEGLGEIFKRFLQLKENLNKKGYFNQKYKKQILGLIDKVTIITSKNGAAIQDFLRNLNNHDCKIETKIIDVPVQGVKSVEKISDVINKINNESKNEIIIITRGGGDYQDLDGFNQMEIIESIFNNRNNIFISAIGHETDEVLMDLVADYSLPTPSLASQFIIDHNNKLLENWYNKIRNLEENIENNILKNLEILNSLEIDLINQENNFERWITKMEMEIYEQINLEEKELDNFYNYLSSTGEIVLKNKLDKKIDKLEDIGFLFQDKTFYLKIRDRTFKITNYSIMETEY